MNTIHHITRIRLALVLAFTMAASVALSAQQSIDPKKALFLTGHVYDRLTSHELPGAMVALLRSDSSLVNEVMARSTIQYGFERTEYHSDFHLPVPKIKGDYILRVAFTGYDTLYVDVPLDNIGSRERERRINGLYLDRATQKLREVTVTATKIKFYHRGDTLVYNADAFQLPEGSMLDALVKQLPGVEFRENGQIYVNGRFVESLLLNGKDFFGSNNRLMLDNIGAYTVKNIEVYDKRGERSEFLGRDLPGDMRYVMDVKLKKEYMAGNMLNVEGGIGTSDRYLGRIFAMHYTNNSRVTFFGNINNLNDSRKPGNSDYWTPDKMPSGTRTERKGGIDYWAENPQHTWNVQGNVQVAHTSAHDNVTVNRTNFFPDGNTYDYIYNTSRNKYLNVSTEHKFYARNTEKTLQMSVKPYFNYQKNDDLGDNAAASFSREQQKIDKALIESIYDADGSSMRSAVINRDLRRSKDAATGYNTGLEFYSGINIPTTPDYIEVQAQAYMTRRRLDRFDRIGIDYGPGPESSQVLNRRFRDRPARDLGAKGSLSYSYFPRYATTLELVYEFEWTKTRKLSDMYRLEALGSVSGSADEEFESVFDPAGSYMSDGVDATHRIIPRLNFNRSGALGKMWVQASLPVSIVHQRLDYRRGAVDTTIVRNTAYASTEMRNTFAQWTLPNPSHVLFLSFYLTPKLPALVDMVDVRDDNDPLNIYEGNSDLKNEYCWKYGLSWSFRPQLANGRSLLNTLAVDYSSTSNALTRGYRYDSDTGVRTYRTYNVSGNYEADVTHGIYLNFGNQGRYSISNNISGTWGEVGDYIGENAEPVRQRVRNFFLRDNFSLGAQFGAQRLWATVGFMRRHTSSERADFADFSATNINYSLNGVFKLPYNFGLSTDLNLYTRRGYMDNAMNTTDFVWNAGVTYTAAKGRLVFMLDGFDLLHRLNNVTYAVNAQGRTETYRNVLPRYVMFHIQYRFDFKPKAAR